MGQKDLLAFFRLRVEPKQTNTKPSNFGDVLLTLGDKGRKKQKQKLPLGINSVA